MDASAADLTALPSVSSESVLPVAEPWFVYLIECMDGSLYTGITNDVTARYAAHCAGKGARYTRSHPPKLLLGWQACADRVEAARLEYRIKRLKPAAKRRFIEAGALVPPPHQNS